MAYEIMGSTLKVNSQNKNGQQQVKVRFMEEKAVKFLQ